MKKFNLSKKKTLILVAIVLAISSVILAILHFTKSKNPKFESIKTTKLENKPIEKFYSPLSGVQVSSKSDTTKPVFGVMIENSPNSRPQSGLKDAEIVFEAVAEGGITRFLALYQQNQPSLIGPVRSLRSYYIDWASGFQASVAHVGGSGDALAKIRSGGRRDMDEFTNTATFWRARDRYAPHNVYTNFENLKKLADSKSWNTSNFEGFKHKNDKKSSSPNATQISINMSGALYNSTFSYNANCNCYLRNQAGTPHLDREKGQISPKNIIALKMNINSRDGYYSDYVTIGSGSGFVFRDGTVEEITWKKPSETAKIILKNSKGEEISLNRGQTWISAVPLSSGAISWQ